MNRNSSIRRAQEEGAYQAIAALINLNVDQTKPIDVFSLIQESGIWLVFGPMGNAFGMFLNQGSPGIFINTSRPPSVQRITAAHEFGHAWLKHGASVDDQDRIEGSRPTELQEAAAQAFALDFLMPEILVETLWDSMNLPGRQQLQARQVYLLSLEIGITYRACVVQLRQMDKIGKEQAIAFLGWQPKQLKKEIGGGIGPADPWADIWPLEETDNGRSIHVRVNDELRLKLPEAPSTGYRWQRLNEDEDDALIAIGDDFEGLSAEKLIASRGHRFLSFRAAEPKAQPLHLVLQRLWEAPASVKEFTLNCVIDPGPAGPNGIGLASSLLKSLLAEGA